MSPSSITRSPPPLEDSASAVRAFRGQKRRQAGALVLRALAGRDEDHRDVREGRVLLDGPAQLEAVDPAHHHVEQDDVRAVHVHGRDEPEPVGGLPHLEPLQLQRQRQHLPRVVVDERVDLELRGVRLEDRKHRRGEQHVAVVAQLDDQHAADRGQVYGVRDHGVNDSKTLTRLVAQQAKAILFPDKRPGVRRVKIGCFQSRPTAA